MFHIDIDIGVRLNIEMLEDIPYKAESTVSLYTI